MAKKAKSSKKVAKSSNKDAEEGKVCAILSYLLIGIIWYFADEKMKKNKFANYHVKQGLVLLITWVIIWVAGVSIPILGWFIILPVGEIFVLVLAILGIINAASGKEKELFLIGKFSSNFKF